MLRVLEMYKCWFWFFARSIYSEWIYWTGTRQRCQEEDSERGDAYVHQLIRNLTDDREQEFNPYFLKDRLFGFKTSLFFINIKGRLELCHNTIAGLKSLKQADSCLTKNKDLMHVSANLKAGPIHFDSWLIFNFLAFERTFKLKGTLKHVKMLCKFTVNTARDKNGSFERLFIRELKEFKFWIEDGFGFLKGPINLTLNIVTILLYLFIRNGIECVLENRIRKTFPRFKFPIEGNSRETASSEVSCEQNADVMENPPKRSRISKQNIGKHLSLSYWCNARSPDEALNLSGSERCTSKGEEQPKTKISISAGNSECTKEAQKVDAKVVSEQDDTSREQRVKTLSDKISLSKRKLNDTFQNALKCKNTLKDLNNDHSLALSNDKKEVQIKSELQISQTQINQDISIKEQSEVTQCTQNIPCFGFNTKKRKKIDATGGIIGNSEQIKTLQLGSTYFKNFKTKPSGTVIREMEGTLAFNDDAKYATSSVSENAIEEESTVQMLSLEEEDAATSELQVVTGQEVVQEKLDNKQSNYEISKSGVTEGKFEELPLEKDPKCVVATSQEIKNAEIGQEIMTQETVVKHVASTSADETDKHQIQFLKDSQYVTANSRIVKSGDAEMSFKAEAETTTVWQPEVNGGTLEEQTVEDEVQSVVSTCVNSVAEETLKMVPLETNLECAIATCSNEIVNLESKQLSSEDKAREVFADIPRLMLSKLVGEIAIQSVRKARTSENAPQYQTATRYEIAKSTFEPTVEAEVKYVVFTSDSTQETNTLPPGVEIVEIEDGAQEMLTFKSDTEFLASTCELESESGSTQENPLDGADLQYPLVSTIVVEGSTEIGVIETGSENLPRGVEIVEIEDGAQEMLTFESDTEFLASTRELESESGSTQENPLDGTDIEYPRVSTIVEGSTEEIGVTEIESENLTTGCECKDSIEDKCVQEKSCLEANMENATTLENEIAADGQEKLHPELDSNILVFSQQTESMENDSETLAFEDELKNEASICEPEVGNESVLEKLTHETESKKLIASCDREVSTEERCAEHDFEEESEFENIDDSRDKSEVAVGKESALELSTDI